MLRGRVLISHVKSKKIKTTKKDKKLQDESSFLSFFCVKKIVVSLALYFVIS